MICNRCGKKNAEKLCDNCLAKIIEKRAKNALAKERITKNAIVADDGSCEGRVSRYLAEKLIKGMKEGRKGIIIAPHTADRKAERFLENMLESRQIRDKLKYISLLTESTSEEVIRYAKIRKIKYHKPKEHKKGITKLLERLEKSHKGTKTALAKAAEQLK